MMALTTAFLVKATETLDEAQRAQTVGIPRQVARLAYFAAFHAAQALILETTTKTAKTHKGVNAQFAMVARDRKLDRSLSQFLSTAYHFKEAADYETGDLRVVTESDAEKALKGAGDFVAQISALLAAIPMSGSPSEGATN